MTLANGQSAQPFAVRDATGAIAVIPIGAEVLLENQGTYQNGSLVESSAITEAGLAALGISFSSGSLFNKRLRCTEGFILPGQTVYILGTAQEGNQDQTANEARLFIGSHPDDVFLIADRSEQDLFARLQWQVPALLWGGAAITAAFVWGLLHWHVASMP